MNRSRERNVTLTGEEALLIDMALCDAARTIARNMADNHLVAKNLVTGAQHMLELVTLAERIADAGRPA